MKRILAVFLVIVAASIIGHAQMRPDKLPPLVSDAIAGPPVMTQIVGGTTPAPAGCTQDNDEALFSATAADSDWNAWDNFAGKITFSTNVTITGYKIKTRNHYDAGSTTVSIYTHNGGTDAPDAQVPGTDKTISVTGDGWSEGWLDTPQDVNAGTYWVYATSPSGNFSLITSSKAGSRSMIGGTFADNYSVSAEVFGCPK